MESILKTSRKACPFLYRTSATALRNLARTPAPVADGGNGLLSMAKKCPVMGKAMAVQSNRYLHSSAPMAQQPTLKLNHASIVNDASQLPAEIPATLPTETKKNEGKRKNIFMELDIVIRQFDNFCFFRHRKKSDLNQFYTNNAFPDSTINQQAFVPSITIQ